MTNLFIFLNSTVPEGRLFGLDQQTLIQIGIQLLNAVILFAFLTKLLYKPVKEFLQKRQDKIAQEIASAEDQMVHVDELKAEYEQKLQDIQKERSEILAQAEAAALKNKEEIIAQAKTEAAEIKEQQAQKAGEDSRRMREEMRIQVIDYSALMAEKFIQNEMDEESKAKYTDLVTAAMEEQSWPS